ncbi:hypothetical protein BSKO_13112 [Bryopsis sp. KO-2023]|nr:hypothetical protein BSKO_13112 [Bryopsis sp. KO-2023]
MLSVSLGLQRKIFALCCWAICLSDCRCRELTQTTVLTPDVNATSLAENRGLADKREVKLFVFGGSDAPKGRYPYLVSIQDEFGAHRCTAVLIHPFWVMSAAHCMIENPEFHIGAHALDDTSSDGVEIRIPKATFVHEFWTGHALDGYDMVLFQLARPSSKTPIKIADESAPISPADRLTIAGWGLNGIDPGVQEILQHATKIHMVELQFCGLRDEWPVSMSDAGLCAIGDTQNTCQGDSGGPLLRPDPQNRRSAENDTLIGITSFGHSDCSETRFPTYFTKVSKFHAWVEEKIAKGPQVDLNSVASEPKIENSDGTENHGESLHLSEKSSVFFAPLLTMLVLVFL